MKESTLPSPGVGSKSYHLRRVAAVVISAYEQSQPDYTNGVHPGSTQLAAFFTACATAATALGLTTPVVTLLGAGNVAAPTVAPAATNQAVLTKGGSGGAATYVSSDTSKATVSGTGLVTGVAPGNVTITVTVAANGSYRAAVKSLAFTITA